MENQVPENIKRQRSERLIAVVSEVREQVLGDILKAKKPLSVIFEQMRGGMWYGHSDTFVEVAVSSSENLHGEMKSVMPISLEGDTVIGEIIN